MENNGKLFYQDEYEARSAAISASGKTWQEIAYHPWPSMKPESAYAKFRCRMNRDGDQQFTLREEIAIMRLCGHYDFLYHLCDETLHARPPRIAPEDEEVKLVDAINGAASVLQKAMTQLERLRSRHVKAAA